MTGINPIVVSTRSGQLVLAWTDRYQVLLPDDTWATKPAADLAVGDILQARGRIVAIWRPQRAGNGHDT